MESDADKGAISYLVNPVIELTAKNVQHGITKNYTVSGYNKLIAAANFITSPTTDSTILGEDTNYLPLTANILIGTISHNGLVASDPSFGLSLDAGILHYDLSDDDNFVDSDGITITSPENITSTASINIRFGRASIENSFGPETVNFPQPFSTQYLNASGRYVVNEQDSCTHYYTSNIIITSGTLNESFTDVDAKLFDENPSAIATFSLFRGNDRIIYQREVFH